MSNSDSRKGAATLFFTILTLVRDPVTTSRIAKKNGRSAQLTIVTTAANKRRELTEQVLQAQLRRAGFALTIQNRDANTLFGQVLPAGTFQLGLYADVVTDPDPGLCTVFCARNIPTPANGQSGSNFTRTSIPTLDPLLEQVDAATNDAARVQASKAADRILATMRNEAPTQQIERALSALVIFPDHQQFLARRPVVAGFQPGKAGIRGIESLDDREPQIAPAGNVEQFYGCALGNGDERTVRT